jgi:serine protease Do
VIVTSVDPGSAAAERGLRAGDVIEEVNHQAVEHPRDVTRAIEGAKADSKKTDAKKPALLLVSTGQGEVRFVAVPVD